MATEEFKTFKFKLENNPLEFLKKFGEPKEIVIKDVDGKEYNVVGVHIEGVN